MPTFDLYPVFGRAGSLVRFAGSGTYTVHDPDSDALVAVTPIGGGVSSSTVTADADGRVAFDTGSSGLLRVRLREARNPASGVVVVSADGGGGLVDVTDLANGYASVASTTDGGSAPGFDAGVAAVVANPASDTRAELDLIYNAKSDAQSRNVRDYGAAGDGITNDQSAFQSAINATPQRRVVVPAGTYKVNSSLTLTAGTHLDLAPGAVLDFSSSASTSAITVTGAKAPVTSAPAVSAGAYTMTVAGHGLAAGDWAKIMTDTNQFDASSTGTRLGELIQVKSVAGDVITFLTPVCDTYTATVTICKITPVDGVRITGGKVKGNRTPDSDKTGLRVQYATNVRVEGVDFADFDQRHVAFDDCVNAKIVGCTFSWTANASLGYGVSFANSTRDSGAYRNRFSECRHSLSTNNTQFGGGIPRRIVFRDNVVLSSAPATGGSGGDAIDTHTAAEDVWILDNTVLGSSGQGINAECPTARVEGNTVRRCASNGIAVHNEADRAGRATVSNNTVSDCDGHGIQVRMGIRGTTFGYASLVVANNRVRDVTGSGIRVGDVAFAPAASNEDNVVVEGNVVTTATGGPGLYVSNVDTCTVVGNTVHDSLQGVVFDDCIYLSAAGNAVRNEAQTNFVGIDLLTVTRSSIHPGAIRASGTGSIGVRIASTCADLTVGAVQGNVFASTKLSNSGPGTVLVASGA